MFSSFSCFSLNLLVIWETVVKLGKMFFISLQKLFSFSRKSNFRFLDIQISIFYWSRESVNETWPVFVIFQKNKNYQKKIAKNATFKLVPGAFVCKEWSATSTGKWNFCPNQHVDLRFIFTEYSLKIEKGLELVSSSKCSHNILIETFLLWYHINWSNFIIQTVFLKLFCKICCVSCFDIWWCLDT